jgi:hypothetical protein
MDEAADLHVKQNKPVSEKQNKINKNKKTQP